MTEEESITLINNRLKQLKEEVDERSKHKNPMYYAALNNYRWCSIVVTLMEGQWPMDSEIEAVCGVKQVRSSTTQLDLTKLVKPGVNVMDIINKYRESVPDIHDQLKRAIEQQHLRVKGFYIVNQED